VRPRIWIGLLCAIAVGTTACDGVFSLHGQVRDPNGKRVPGAAVAVYGKAFPDSGLRTSTDSSGSFAFFKVIAPFQFAARLEIDKGGHHSATASITKPLDPHRVAVTLRPSGGQVVSEVQFVDPAQD
jgi:hypothetical protein